MGCCTSIPRGPNGRPLQQPQVILTRSTLLDNLKFIVLLAFQIRIVRYWEVFMWRTCLTRLPQLVYGRNAFIEFESRNTVSKAIKVFFNDFACLGLHLDKLSLTIV